MQWYIYFEYRAIYSNIRYKGVCTILMGAICSVHARVRRLIVLHASARNVVSSDVHFLPGNQQNYMHTAWACSQCSDKSCSTFEKSDRGTLSSLQDWSHLSRASSTWFNCLFAEIWSQDPEDLEFEKDDIMIIISKDEEAWWTARHTVSGKQGSIPVPYVEVVSFTDSASFMPYVHARPAQFRE